MKQFKKQKSIFIVIKKKKAWKAAQNKTVDFVI